MIYIVFPLDYCSFLCRVGFVLLYKSNIVQLIAEVNGVNDVKLMLGPREMLQSLTEKCSF